MIKNINVAIMFLLLPLILNNQAMARGVNKYWYQLPEEQEINSSPFETDKSLANLSDSLDSIDKTLDILTEAHKSVLETNEKIGGKEEASWQFVGFKTNIGLSLSGKLGPLSWGGAKAIVLEWSRRTKKSNKIKLLEENEEAPLTINFSSTSTMEDINKQMGPVIRLLVRSGKVNDESNLRKNLFEKGLKFFELARVMGTTQKTQWYPGKMWLDLKIKASGSISALSVGGSTRVRLQLVKLQKAGTSTKEVIASNETQKKMQTLLTALAEDISAAEKKRRSKSKFVIKAFRVGLSMSASGTIGVAKGGITFNPMVFFFKHTEEIKPKKIDEKTTLPLIVKTNLEVAEKYAKKVGISYNKSFEDEGIFQVKRKRLRKGFRKAIKFGQKMAVKISKRENPQSKFGVKVIKSNYKISVGGSAGVVNVGATPSFMIRFVNPNF